MTTADATLAAAPDQPRAALAPVREADRIFTLDMLRGWAILGILAVNAVAFAWPWALEADPTLPHPWDASQANTVAAWVETVFFQDKFRSLFSMLFGVSVFLIGGERSDEARGGLLRRRLSWLLLFGLIHGLALWYGDILMNYAYTGFIMLLCRSWSAGKLIGWGLGINLTAGLLSAAAMMLQAMAPAGAGGQGNPFGTTPEAFDALVAAYRGPFPAALVENMKAWLFLQGFSLVLMPITLGLMMLGLGLFKSGFLTGRSPAWVYLIVLALGAANLAAYGWLEWRDATVEGPDNGLSGVAGSFAWLITLGYASMLILMTRFGLKVLTARLAPVGRMAFTNYLSQTLIMTTLFYMPWGPKWFGTMGPAELWTVVAAVWIAQLIWSPLWLSVFQFGPFEWLWRCLTYGRAVPLLKSRAA